MLRVGCRSQAERTRLTTVGEGQRVARRRQALKSEQPIADWSYSRWIYAISFKTESLGA